MTSIRLFCPHPMLMVFAALLISGCEPKTPPPALTAPPPWAKEAIWYQIFPERFRNGDPANDPQFHDTFGSWPHDTLSPWQQSPWTADWYKLQPWEAANGREFNYQAGRRRFGGDLQGVIDKLDYLQELGVTALYFNPIFEAPTLHKYDTQLYHHVDNNFGPAPQRDREIWATENFNDPSTWKWSAADSLFLKLIAEVHRRNMRIIIDGVFNHVGVTHPAFVDVQKNGRASPYADWFVIKSWDDPATPQNEFDYQGWYGVKDLPEIREEGDDLAAGFKPLVQAVVRRWMDPNGDGNPADGIDGWRLDVAEMVPKGFWRQFRQWVREINPEAYLTGEVWWENYSQNKMFNAAPWLQGDIFDAVMNYRFADGVLKFFVDTKNAYSPEQFEAHLAQIRADYSPEAGSVLMNLISSHDTERLGSMVVNPNRMIDHDSSPQHNPGFDVRKPDAEELRTHRLIAAFQLLYPGAPMIYYGEEAGMWGADDPDDRKPMVWPDLVYESERSHPRGRPRPADSVFFDQQLFDHYKTFTALRRQNPALQRGDYQYVKPGGGENLFAFVRRRAGQTILCLFNRASAPEHFILPADFQQHTILAGGENLELGAAGAAVLEGKSAAVLLAR